MRKLTLLALSFAAIALLSVGLSSCKDDDEPATNAKLSFADEEMTVGEDDGQIEIEVVLDKPASSDITIEYEVGGNATEGSTDAADYEIDGSFGEIEIAKGETTGIIEITINNDASFEENETIELSLEAVDPEVVDITNDDEITITIDDDDVQNLVSFTSTTALNVEEGAGLQTIQIQLQQAAASAVTVTYTMTGTARDSATAVNAEPQQTSDYAVRRGTPGSVTIPAGQTTANIYIFIYRDLLLEDGDVDTDPWEPETATLTLTAATGGVSVDDTKKALDVNISQEDGRLVLLLWPEPDGDAEADMDLIVRYGANTTTWTGVLAASAAESTEGIEAVFLPKALSPTAYGMSYTYYGGTLDPLEFSVVFIDFADNQLEGDDDMDEYSATYTAANKNAWTSVSTTQVVQTMTKAGGGDFDVPSGITVPTTGSRLPAPPASEQNVMRRDFEAVHAADVLNKLRHR